MYEGNPWGTKLTALKIKNSFTICLRLKGSSSWDEYFLRSTKLIFYFLYVRWKFVILRFSCGQNLFKNLFSKSLFAWCNIKKAAYYQNTCTVNRLWYWICAENRPDMYIYRRIFNRRRVGHWRKSTYKIERKPETKFCCDFFSVQISELSSVFIKPGKLFQFNFLFKKPA